MKRNINRRMLLQRFLGALLLLTMIVIIVMAFHGTSAQGRDITAAIPLTPLALYLIFTKKQIIH